MAPNEILNHYKNLQVGNINANKMEKEVILLSVSITMNYKEKKRIFFNINTSSFLSSHQLLSAKVMHIEQLLSKDKYRAQYVIDFYVTITSMQ